MGAMVGVQVQWPGVWVRGLVRWAGLRVVLVGVLVEVAGLRGVVPVGDGRVLSHWWDVMLFVGMWMRWWN